jgi:hypothetical protein
MNTLFILLNLGGKNNIEVISFPTNPELSNKIGLSLGEGR